MVEFDDLAINEEYHKVFLHGQEVALTGKEYSILTLLVSNPERVYTYEQIFEIVWKDSYIGDKRRIIGHVHELRKKLDGAGSIKSIRDVGYQFQEKSEEFMRLRWFFQTLSKFAIPSIILTNTLLWR